MRLRADWPTQELCVLCSSHLSVRFLFTSGSLPFVVFLTVEHLVPKDAQSGMAQPIRLRDSRGRRSESSESENARLLAAALDIESCEISGSGEGGQLIFPHHAPVWAAFILNEVQCM